MVYEARPAVRANYLLAGACVLLSSIGFAAAGIIPNNSGYYPVTGWSIVAICFAIAFVFLRRGRGNGIEARIDGRGVYAPRFSSEPVPWSRIRSVLPIRHGVQRIVRFELTPDAPQAADNAMLRATGALDRALGFGDFGINTTYLDHGLDELLAAVRHYRPDLFDENARL